MKKQSSDKRRSRPITRRVVHWVALGALTVGAGFGATAAGLPNAFMLGALIIGLGNAVLTNTALEPARVAFIAAQAVVGVSIGSLLRPAAAQAVLNHWFAVILGSSGTLAVSIIAGLVLARAVRIDRLTASFGMIAGGAAGVIAASDEFGADDGLVAGMQYVRVVIIVLALPLVTGLLGKPSTGAYRAMHPPAGWIHSTLFVVAAACVGLVFARAVSLPTGMLLGPLLVAAIVSLGMGSVSALVPSWLQDCALALIGLRVGLRFTPSRLRLAGRILPGATVAIILMVAACGAMGIGLAGLLHVSRLDGYLATSPGGLTVILGTVAATKTNAAFVVAQQILRILLMLLVAPGLARWIVSARGTTSPQECHQ